MTVGSSRTALRLFPLRLISGANGQLISRPAISITRATRAFARALCPCWADRERCRIEVLDRCRLTYRHIQIRSPPGVDRPYCITLTGVGGTGVVTIGAIIGMAAHVAKMGCSVLDMAGLAQKGWSSDEPPHL